MALSVADFIAKWAKTDLSERASYQQHFLDLCALTGHPAPAALDPTGESFCFEKGVEKHGGGDGWADVWKKGAFAFEYKGRHANLAKAYDQLLRYRASLENPPLLVVCDTDVIEIHTNFTGTAERVLRITSAGLAEPRNLETLHALFHNPGKLRPGITSETVTRNAASALAGLAGSLRGRGQPAEPVARFLDRMIFCLFAEDVGLLPADMFSRLVGQTRGEPERFARYAGELFRAMADGGEFQYEKIRHFNGGLFSDVTVLELAPAELDIVHAACGLDWGAVDASIFGTLFQRGLDPATRAALGAEYTGRRDIEDLIDPVLLAPLRHEWESLKITLTHLLRTGKKTPKPADFAKPPAGPALRKALEEGARLKHAFLLRLSRVHVLDPACGSGNFLYIALQKLKDLEKEVILFGGGDGLETGFFPGIGPWQFHGIEINPYAFELAQMTLWIGYLQWHRGNGYPLTTTPLLKKLENFHFMDALLDLSDPANPKERQWPTFRADHEVVVVGNPPFLGDKMMRRELGDDYVESLRKVFHGRLPGQSDLCCYWFEKTRALIADDKVKRAGLLATQAIRGGANREVLKRIKESGDIFFAVSDRDWILDGANVHISMVGFCSKEWNAPQRSAGVPPDLDNEAGGTPALLCVLDGVPVGEIHANLSAAANIATANVLPGNSGIGFIGVTKGGSFDITDEEGRAMLASAGNPNGLPNSDVIKPICNGMDILRRGEPRWLVDNSDMTRAEAQMFEKPFEIIISRVKPARDSNRNKWLKENWWKLQRIRPELRASISNLPRFIATPRVAKHRIFSWFTWPLITDDQTVVFARSDDFFFGVLHSRIHEAWSLAQGTQLREKESGFRYTPTTCFETFPFPWDHRMPPDELTSAQQAQHGRISAAALELDTLRRRWLNPPEWTREEVLEFPASIDGPWARYVTGGMARYPRLVPRDAECATRLAERTLTKLYNTRPAWLAAAHAALDAAVAEAYGFPPDLPAKTLTARLLERNATQG